MIPTPRSDSQIPNSVPRGEPGPRLLVTESRGKTGDLVDVVLRLFTGLALVLAIALLATLLLVAVHFASLTGGVGLGSDPLGDAARQTTTSIQQSAQAVADRLDPAHPPREALRQDTEFDELRLVTVGGSLSQGEEYKLTLTAIAKRDGVSSADQAQYAAVQRSYVQPRETRILGQVIRTDRGEEDYYLYKGETFQVGNAYYKVNWVSYAQQEIAIARYRNADDVTATPKFQVK